MPIIFTASLVSFTLCVRIRETPFNTQWISVIIDGISLSSKFKFNNEPMNDFLETEIQTGLFKEDNNEMLESILI